MNILYSLNDKFVPQVATGICSICENNNEVKEIVFYIISYGISAINKNELKKIGKKYGRKVEIIELDHLERYFDFDFDTLGWNKVILARILMGKILPKEVKRILYLDGDTIVIDKLDDLWKTDLNGNTLGMSIEPTVDKIRKKELGLEKYPYYNSGVLLVDLKKWRDTKADERIIQFYKNKGGNLFAADQDAINGALKDEIYSLPPKYNFYNIFYQYPYSFMCKLMHPINYFDKEVYNDSKKNPIIIHYLGEERPWRKGNTHKYKSDYLKYLGMTCWKDTEMEDGWRLYFICWNIFNIVTKPFPSIRYNIINSLIPKFMKIREKKLKSKFRMVK